MSLAALGREFANLEVGRRYVHSMYTRHLSMSNLVILRDSANFQDMQVEGRRTQDWWLHWCLPTI